MKLVSLENITKYNELLNQKMVKSVNSVKPDSTGNVTLGTEKSTFNKVEFDTGYFSISATKTYNFDLTGTDLENVPKDNINIRLVAKVVTAHNGFEVGDIAQLSTALDALVNPTEVDICTYIRSNTLYVRSGDNPYLSIHNGNKDGWLEKSKAQIKVVLTAFIPDDGSILLIAEDQNNTSKLIGLPDGTLTWKDKNLVRSVNGVNADASGNVQLGTIGDITGEITWFAFNEAPEGYLVCNGATVSRETYADLFAVIGTTFGSGNGSTTFTLPNLIDKFAQGSTTVGTVKSAGLPNISGGAELNNFGYQYLVYVKTSWGGIYSSSPRTPFASSGNISSAGSLSGDCIFNIDASRSNSIYGNSETVQPPALTLLPCIKY